MVLVIIQHWRPCHVRNKWWAPSRKSLRNLWNLPGNHREAGGFAQQKLRHGCLNHDDLNMIIASYTFFWWVQPIWTNNNYTTWSSSSIFGGKTKTQLQPSPPEQVQISGFDRVYFRAFDHFVAQFLRECPHLTLPAIMNHHSSIPTNMRRKNLKSLGLHGRCLVVPCHPGSEVLSHDAACDFGYFFVKEQDVHRKPRKLHSYKRKNMCLTQDSTKYLETKTHEQKTPNTSKKTKSCCVGPFHCKDTHCHIGDQFQLQNNDKNLRSCPDLLDKRLRRKLRGPKSLPLLTDWMRCFVGCWDMLGYKCNIFPVGKRVLFLPISITHSIHVPTFIPSKSQQNM